MPELQPAILLSVLLCALAAITDARTGLIPNWLTFPVIAGAPLVHAFIGGPGALPGSLLGALLCGLVPYLMFRRGGMGGGDVKLFASLGAVAGLGFGLQVQVVSMAVACLWGLGLLAYRGELLAMLWRWVQPLLRVLRLSRARELVGVDAAGHEVRLGVPIAIATLACAISEHLALAVVW